MVRAPARGAPTFHVGEVVKKRTGCPVRFYYWMLVREMAISYVLAESIERRMRGLYRSGPQRGLRLWKYLELKSCVSSGHDVEHDLFDWREWAE